VWPPWHPVISADGTTVAFGSFVRNLGEGTTIQVPGYYTGPLEISPHERYVYYDNLGLVDTFQVNTLTVGGIPAAGQVYEVSISNTAGPVTTVSYTALAGDDNVSITSALLGGLQSSSIPEFAQVTWAAGSSYTAITATSKVLGGTFTQASSATGTGTFTTS